MSVQVVLLYCYETMYSTVQHYIGIHLIVVDISQSGPQWWTDGLLLSWLEILIIAASSSEFHVSHEGNNLTGTLSNKTIKYLKTKT